ncbi:MAG TPA: AAA family ATPase [Steroidobacteraceae bacterium]|nr:AAA family ATPase [Steroidobacteraceae bacterium]
MNPRDEFRAAMAERQIVPPQEIIADGKIHRCDAEGKNGRGDAAYLLHGDGIPAGGFENHRDGQGWQNWRANLGRHLSPAEEAALQARIKDHARQRERAEAARSAETMDRAHAIWDAAGRTVGDHPYLAARGICSHKVRVFGGELTIGGVDCSGALVIPMRDAAGELRQAQLISLQGEKRFLPGPKPAGLYCSIGKPSGIVCIVEGFATGASVHEATGYAVAVAFDCGNLAEVTRVIRSKMPDARIILCADDDYKTAGNPGLTSATAAARSVGAVLAVPVFGNSRPDGAKDFNDLARFSGHDVVKACIDGATTVQMQGEAPPMAGLVCASKIKPEAITWLWKEWIAAGKLHILAGAPGTAKTTAALDWASVISRGGRWPDGSMSPIGDVLIWSSEDDPKDTLVPRLTAMHADLSRVHFVTTAADGDRRRAFDPATDMDQLRAAIAQMGILPRLLIVDPIVSAVGGDSHKGSDTRRSLQPLVDLGADRGCAILGISHFSKGTAGRNVVERVTGSLAFGALARLVFAAAKMPDEEGGGRFIARAKSNIGPDGGGYHFDLDQVPLPDFPAISASLVSWGESIEGRAEDILARAETSEDAEERSDRSDAEDFLRDLLAGGCVKAQNAIRQAKAAGISEKSLRTACKRLGVTKKKADFSGGWTWCAPHAEGARRSQDAQDARPLNLGTLGAFDEKGHLGHPIGHGIDTDAEVF